MAKILRPLISSLLLLFAFLNCSTSADDSEIIWRGSRRLIVLEEIYPLKKKLEQRWVRGWDCGWTPYGLCFSPYWRQDIHDNFIIPFKDLKFSVYVDEIVIPRFGLGSVVLTEFSQKKNYLWEARVYRYRAGWNSKYGRMLAYQLFVTTDFVDLKVQLKESFHPNSVRKKEAHHACREFDTECKSYETCIPKWYSGHLWPNVYRCACTKRGWHVVRGRGCMDFDECTQSPCGELFVCENTIGSYKCNCRPGYKGKKCDVEIDACKKNPCPENRVCKDVPEGFQCNCLSGFAGKNCSEPATTKATEVMGTAPIIQDYGNKRLAIPRKKPMKILRKPVFSYNPRRMEIAFMSISTVLLNGLGMFLYWKQRKKRAKNRNNDKGPSESSNQELKNEETVSINQELEHTEGTNRNRQELNFGETILSDQLLENNEMISRSDELKMSSESSQRNDEIEDNEAIQSDKELRGSEANSRHN